MRRRELIRGPTKPSGAGDAVVGSAFSEKNSAKKEGRSTAPVVGSASATVPMVAVPNGSPLDRQNFGISFEPCKAP